MEPVAGDRRYKVLGGESLNQDTANGALARSLREKYLSHRFDFSDLDFPEQGRGISASPAIDSLAIG
jgi:hypothetical protein